MATNAKPTPKKEQKKQGDFIFAVGRRKEAVARVRLYRKDNKQDNIEIMVNDKPVGQYFHGPAAQLSYAQPFDLTKTRDRFSATVKVVGSGLSSQLDAVLHGISRALVKADADFKPVLKKHGLLQRDPRERQKRMIGRGGRARAKKQSPKR